MRLRLSQSASDDFAVLAVLLLPIRRTIWQDGFLYTEIAYGVTTNPSAVPPSGIGRKCCHGIVLRSFRERCAWSGDRGGSRRNLCLRGRRKFHQTTAVSVASRNGRLCVRRVRRSLPAP